MKVTVRVVPHTDDDAGTPSVIREVFSLDRDTLTPDTVGLRLSEASL